MTETYSGAAAAAAAIALVDFDFQICVYYCCFIVAEHLQTE